MDYMMKLLGYGFLEDSFLIEELYQDCGFFFCVAAISWSRSHPSASNTHKFLKHWAFLNHQNAFAWFESTSPNCHRNVTQTKYSFIHFAVFRLGKRENMRHASVGETNRNNKSTGSIPISKKADRNLQCAT